MSEPTASNASPATAPTPGSSMRIEIVVLPVADPERSKRFYARLGWRLDIDFAGEDGYRVIQFTPPDSDCSIMIGHGITNAAPGSTQAVHLIVPDIEAAQRDLLSRGVEVFGPFHDEGGVFHHVDRLKIAPGPNPQRRSYGSYLSFKDPDGNGWVLQEITARLGPGLAPDDPRFTPEVLRAIGTTHL